MKASLTNDAAELWSSFTITDSNYHTALDVLKKRYENPRMIAGAHVQRIFDLPNMQNDNGKDLRKLIEGVEEHRLSLQRLGLPVENYDLFLNFLITECLDQETRLQWERASPGTDIQDYDNLKAFIETRCNALEASTQPVKKFVTQSRSPAFPQSNPSYSGTQANELCVFCGKEHKLYSCPKYSDLSVETKADFIKKVCFNCVRTGHLLKDCTSPNKCKECNRSHHTYIHCSYTNARVNSATEAPEAVASHSAINNKQIVLPTAIIYVQGRHGTVSLSALLDSGSQTSFLTEDACQKVNWAKQPHNLAVSGLGGKTSVCTGTLNLEIWTSSSNTSNVKVFVLPKLFL